MRPEVNSNRFEISNRFEKSFRLYGNFTVSNLESSNRFQHFSHLHEGFSHLHEGFSHLHGGFTAATFQTIARLNCTYADDIF